MDRHATETLLGRQERLEGMVFAAFLFASLFALLTLLRHGDNAVAAWLLGLLERPIVLCSRQDRGFAMRVYVSPGRPCDMTTSRAGLRCCAWQLIGAAFDTIAAFEDSADDVADQDFACSVTMGEACLEAWSPPGRYGQEIGRRRYFAAYATRHTVGIVAYAHGADVPAGFPAERAALTATLRADAEGFRRATALLAERCGRNTEARRALLDMLLGEPPAVGHVVRLAA